MDNKKHNELDCDIVRDLLPLYHDGVVNETTRRAVEQHISGCDRCRNELKELQADLPGEESSAPVTRNKFANMMRTQKKKRVLWTGISAILIIGILIGAYFGQLQLPIFNVPDEEITVHRAYRYETDEGYKFFLIYSAPHYDYMHLGTKIDSEGSKLTFNLKKPLISKKQENEGRAEVYIYGWEGNDGGDFSFEQVGFGGKTIWTKDNAADPVPEYVYACEEMHSDSSEVKVWVTGAGEGYVGILYADGEPAVWDFDGKEFKAFWLD